MTRPGDPVIVGYQNKEGSMSQEFGSAIAALRQRLAKQEREVRESKRMINQLVALEGGEIPYPGAEQDDEEAADLGSLRRDQFYGVPLATAIREYLKMRRTAGAGPATVNDLYNALQQGGFTFDTKNAANAKRGLYISLAKNATVFHKLPGGTNDAAVFGLTEWYPAARVAAADKTAGEKRSKRRSKSKKSGRHEAAPKPDGPAKKIRGVRRGPATEVSEPAPAAGDKDDDE